MTVLTTTTKQSYTGNGTSTLFSFPYPFIATSDIIAYINGTPTTAFTISGTAPFPTGANVVFNTPPANGAAILLTRIRPFTQTLDLVENDPLPADQVELLLGDHQVMLMQQLNEALSRAFSFAITDTSGASATVPTPVANKALLWNSAGTALITSTDDFNNIVTNATAQAAAAAASAVTASAASLSGTSSTSVLIATGSETFTTQTGKNYTGGAWLTIASNANVNNYMFGQITSYNSATGALVVNVTAKNGSGTFADWIINISGVQGAVGAPIANGTYGSIVVTGGGLTWSYGNASLDLTTKVTGILPLANGGTGVSSSVPILQRAYSSNNAYTTLSTVIPIDDTTPQITEGTLILTATLTPTTTTSTFRIRAQAPIGSGGAASNVAIAAFINGATNSVIANQNSVTSSTAIGICLIEYEYVPGSLTAQAITIRAGANNTSYLNGTSVGREFGGVMRATLIIEEILT